MRKMQLSTKIFIGFGIGILLGIIFKEQATLVKPIGQLFLKLIKMVIVPLVACTIISGISNLGDVTKLKRIGSKILAYYILTTILAGTVGIIVSNVLRPGANFVLQNAEKTDLTAAKTPSLVQTVLDMFPDNPIASLSSGNLVQIIIFCAFIGASITIAGEKAQSIKKFFDEASEVVYKLTEIVMSTAPIGVAALMADTVGTYGLKIFGPLGKFILADYIGAILIAMVVYALILKLVVGIRLSDFYRNAAKVWVVTASTTSSSATLPVTMDVTEKNLGAPKEIAGFTLPLGATINMDGAANFFAISVIFVAQIYGVPLTIAQQAIIVALATLLSVGAPGIPGGGIALIMILLNTMGLPLEVVSLIAGIYRIVDVAHTTVNVTGDMVGTLVVSKLEKMWSPDMVSMDERAA